MSDELARLQRQLSEKELGALDRSDPVVLLLYEIMRRGSMLEETLAYLIDRIALEMIDEPTNDKDRAYWKSAQRLNQRLPWRSV